MLRTLTRLFRRMIRGLMTEKPHVGSAERVVRAVLLVPLFGLVLVMLRCAARLRGPLPVEAQLANGVKLRCHLPDLIQMYLYLFGRWEPDLSEHLERVLRPGDTVIDIGANVGYFSLLAADRVGPDGRVIAIEASPRMADTLREHVAMNDATRCVTVIGKAVSDESGVLTIYDGPIHNRGLTSTEQHRGMKPVGEVEAAPLEKLVGEEAISAAKVIKIDVEGGEDRVLRDLANHLDGFRGDLEILVELSPIWWRDVERTPHKVLEPFVRKGFRIDTISNSYWPWRYLWPRDVNAPQPLSGGLDAPILKKRVKRLDLRLVRAAASDADDPDRVALS
ncbi:MAG: FkbM family methyltransferase [Phycisphaerales bacterium]|nr:MAG: FkbM family methyltransferase [Phycisphaerales bacterium]